MKPYVLLSAVALIISFIVVSTWQLRQQLRWYDLMLFIPSWLALVIGLGTLLLTDETLADTLIFAIGMPLFLAWILLTRRELYRVLDQIEDERSTA